MNDLKIEREKTKINNNDSDKNINYHKIFNNNNTKSINFQIKIKIQFYQDFHEILNMKDFCQENINS